MNPNSWAQTYLGTTAWSDDEDKLYGVVFKAYKKVRETSNAVLVTIITTDKQ